MKFKKYQRDFETDFIFSGRKRHEDLQGLIIYTVSRILWSKINIAVVIWPWRKYKRDFLMCWKKSILLLIDWSFSIYVNNFKNILNFWNKTFKLSSWTASINKRDKESIVRCSNPASDQVFLMYVIYSMKLTMTISLCYQDYLNSTLIAYTTFYM